MKTIGAALLATLLTANALSSQTGERTTNAAARARECPSCAEWNAPQKPFRLYGNSWFVGTHGLSAVLLTSANGHVLIDAGLPESAPLIAQNIATLGFRMQDVKLIVNSHDHYDHAGGIAELQKLSGARVAASAPSAKVLQDGDSENDDPQFGLSAIVRGRSLRGHGIC
jgi:metallo-beta-lactamase class B